MAKSRFLDSRPTELELVELTVTRIDRVAARVKLSQQSVCREIMKDNRLYVHLVERIDALRSGSFLQRQQTRSITMALYDRIHEGLDELEATAA